MKKDDWWRKLKEEKSWQRKKCDWQRKLINEKGTSMYDMTFDDKMKTNQIKLISSQKTAKVTTQVVNMLSQLKIQGL